MNIDDFKNMRRITESTRIHGELFKQSILHSYYHFGMAQGFYGLSSMLEAFKDHTFTGQDILDIIKNAVEHNDDMKEYFDRLSKV